MAKTKKIRIDRLDAEVKLTLCEPKAGCKKDVVAHSDIEKILFEDFRNILEVTTEILPSSTKHVVAVAQATIRNVLDGSPAVQGLGEVCEEDLFEGFGTKGDGRTRGFWYAHPHYLAVQRAIGDAFRNFCRGDFLTDRMVNSFPEDKPDPVEEAPAKNPVKSEKPVKEPEPEVLPVGAVEFDYNDGSTAVEVFDEPVSDIPFDEEIPEEPATTAPPAIPNADFQIGFGKFKGQTLAQLWETDRGKGYLHWVEDNISKEEVRKAVAEFLAAVEG